VCVVELDSPLVANVMFRVPVVPLNKVNRHGSRHVAVDDHLCPAVARPVVVTQPRCALLEGNV
jgi:hypothetical protein